MSEIAVGLLVATASVLLGATIQTYRSRSRFFTVISNVSETRYSSAEVPLSTDVQTKLEQSDYLPSWEKVVTVSELDFLVESCVDLRDNADEILGPFDTAIDRLETTASTDEVLAATMRVIRLTVFDFFVQRVLMNRPLFEPPTEDNSTGVVVKRHDGDGGRFSLDVPGLPTTYIGFDLNSTPAIENRLLPFVEAIRAGDRRAIRAGLVAVRDQIRRESVIARDLLGYLEPVSAQFTHWQVVAHIANYGPSGIFLFPSATMIETYERSGGSISVNMLVAVLQEADGDAGFVPVEGGLMIAPNELREIAFITPVPRKDLPEGNVLGAHFEDQTAEIRIQMTYIGTGFKRQNTASTNAVPFAQGASEAPRPVPEPSR